MAGGGTFGECVFYSSESVFITIPGALEGIINRLNRKNGGNKIEWACLTAKGMWWAGPNR